MQDILFKGTNDDMIKYHCINNTSDIIKIYSIMRNLSDKKLFENLDIILNNENISGNIDITFDSSSITTKTKTISIESILGLVKIKVTINSNTTGTLSFVN